MSEALLSECFDKWLLTDSFDDLYSHKYVGNSKIKNKT